MGVVYKGLDTRLRRHVALKFLSRSLADQTTARTRFLREARAAAALEHVNVCSIFEIGDAESHAPFIVMGFCDGRSLREILSDGPLSVQVIISVARQIASGLAHAHRSGVVHRDLKPGNVMITRDDVVKIVDFGIANVRDSTTGHVENERLGTAAYMSPEQLHSDPVDQRTDIFSFGVVLYEMVAGSNPFLAEYDQATIYNVLHLDPPPLRNSRTDVPPELESLVRACLEKDPARRCPSFEAVLRDLPPATPGASTTAQARFEGYLPKIGGRAYVGRASESETLAKRLASPGGTTTLVFGESGIGKTQFVSRVVAQRVLDGGRALWGRCLFNEGALPYHPFVTALKRGFPAGSDPAAEIETLAIQAGIDFRGRSAQLRAFLSVSDDSDEVMNREQLWHTMLLTYRVLSGADRPLYLVVDDLQWGDPATLALFCYLARSADQSSIHLIGIYRLDASSGRGGVPHEVLAESLRQLRIDGLADQLALERFDRGDADALVNAMLEGDEVADDLKTYLFDLSEGLPLFLAESLSLLRFEGRIKKVSGIWRLPPSTVRKASVPDRIQDIILQRLDALSEEDRELLEVAAIEGEVFRSEPLEAGLGWPRIKVLKRLQAIEKKFQLIEHEPSGYRFDHAMIRQVLYDGILPELRAEYHRIIASELEVSHGQDDDYASVIALHLVASDQELSAVPYLLRAGDRARAVHASEQALQVYEELDRIRHRRMPDDESVGMAVSRGLGDVRYALGDVQSATEHYGLYLELARSSGNLRAELEARRKLGECLRVIGRLEEALDMIERTLTIAESAGARDEAVKILHTFAEVCASRGQYTESAEFAARALQMAEESGDRANMSVAESILGFAYWHMGAFRDSQSHFSKALDTQREIGNRLGMATTLNFLALALWKLGRFEEAIRAAEESVAIKRRTSLFRAVPGSLNIIGDVYRDVFALDAAIRIHEESLSQATVHDNKGGMCDNLRDLGADYLEKGDGPKAEQFMRRALALARSSGIKWYETRALIGLAEALAVTGESPEAHRHAVRGLELAEEIQARELLIEAKWKMALVDREDTAESRRLLEEALEGADQLELKPVAWRIRSDLADLYLEEGLGDAGERLRSEANEIVGGIADQISDNELRNGFLASGPVRRIRSG